MNSQVAKPLVPRSTAGDLVTLQMHPLVRLNLTDASVFFYDLQESFSEQCLNIDTNTV